MILFSRIKISMTLIEWLTYQLGLNLNVPRIVGKIVKWNRNLAIGTIGAICTDGDNKVGNGGASNGAKGVPHRNGAMPMVIASSPRHWFGHFMWRH
jgi:hypothetical protein